MYKENTKGKFNYIRKIHEQNKLFAKELEIIKHPEIQ